MLCDLTRMEVDAIPVTQQPSGPTSLDKQESGHRLQLVAQTDTDISNYIALSTKRAERQSPHPSPNKLTRSPAPKVRRRMRTGTEHFHNVKPTMESTSGMHTPLGTGPPSQVLMAAEPTPEVGVRTPLSTGTGPPSRAQMPTLGVRACFSLKAVPKSLHVVSSGDIIVRQTYQLRQAPPDGLIDSPP